MKRILTLAAVSSTALTLAACTGAAAPSPSASAPPLDSYVTSTPPGTGPLDLVTWNLADGEPITLDPNLAWSGSQNFVSTNVCESLLAFTPEGSIVPGLATAVDQPDDTTVVVTLREGVTFSDGTPMTADDVVFSIERARTDPASQFAGDLKSVATVEATDASTVTLTLSQPDVLVRSALATGAGAVVSKAFVEANADTFGKPGGTLMCTGPYTLTSWESGKGITIEANPTWWGKGDGKQLTKQIDFTFVTDPAAAAAAMQSGEIDGSFLLPPSSVPSLQKSDTGTVAFGRGTAFGAWVPIINGGGSMANPKLREALAKAIDYQGLIKASAGGAGTVTRALATPGSWGYAVDAYRAAWDALPDPAQDLEAAKKLVAESGVSNPRLVITCFGELPDSVNSALALQAVAMEVGFDASVKKVGFDYAGKLFSGEPKPDDDVFETNYLSIVTDPLSIYSQVGLPDGSANWGGYDNPEAVDLLTKALATPDDDERAQLTIEAQTLITADHAWIPTVVSPNVYFMNNRVTGAVVTAPAQVWTSWATQLGASG